MGDVLLLLGREGGVLFHFLIPKMRHYYAVIKTCLKIRMDGSLARDRFYKVHLKNLLSRDEPLRVRC